MREPLGVLCLSKASPNAAPQEEGEGAEILMLEVKMAMSC